MHDFRLTINKDTRLCMSLASRPGNVGTRLHNYMYAALGLNYVYKSFTTHTIDQAIAGIRALGIRGCAISMPFKEAVIPLLDTVEPSAARISAVNTIVNDNGVLTGLNTDYLAIQRVFVDHAVPQSSSVAVFGSGGMAKAIVSALDDAGYRDVTVVARNKAAGHALASLYGYQWHADWPADRGYDVLVNASPVGMAPNADESPCPEALVAQAKYVIDSVANPIQTQLIQTAQRLGKQTVNGFAIMVIQSVEQFALYTGVMPDAATVEAARAFVLSFEG